MRIVMIGAGYVGLVSGACFADFGHDVTCIDKDADKIAALKQCRIPIFEPDLGKLVETGIDSGRLKFGTDLSCISSADAVFIAVGTPSRRGDGHADLSYVHAAAREIAVRLTDFTVIVTKSTVPVGTGDEVERIIRETNPAADFAVASNPEFLREGAAIRDFQHPDRIVVGTEDDRARKVMGQIYRPLYLNQAPILYTSRRTAELIKYAANAFLATKITFINEMADLCEQVGSNVGELALGMGLDRRIGTSFLNAGPGYGGSCFPKDTMALLRTAQDYGVSVRIVEETVTANEARKRRMALKVMDALDNDVQGRTIAVLGLTFKPDTDDMRDAPSVPLIETLQRFGAQIRAYDPVGVENASRILSDVELHDDAYECARGADAVVVVTEWDSIRKLDLARLKKVMRQAVLIDLRNAFAPDIAEALGFRVSAIGRPTSRQDTTSRGLRTHAGFQAASTSPQTHLESMGGSVVNT